MKRQVFLDLDGTLLNVKPKNLFVYHSVANRLGLPLLSDDEYWERKKRHILPWDEKTNAVETYAREFYLHIEDKEALAHDTLFDGALELISWLSSQTDLYIATKRYNRTTLLEQLSSLTILNYFKDILSLKDPSHPKESLFEGHSVSATDIIVGDTEEDLMIAEKLGIKSVGVTWGVRIPIVLKAFDPTYIVSSFSELHTCIEKLIV